VRRVVFLCQDHGLSPFAALRAVLCAYWCIAIALRSVSISAAPAVRSYGRPRTAAGGGRPQGRP
jgi:hypothetical protein